ncbi:MAG TPA: hypothetical protein VI753_09010 [Anaerolineales bacterium]|nr:hypothetical protein [Anaerolineales bacterium]
MNLTVLIEVAIGVLFVWILLAAITSAVQDWISQLFKWKSDMLEESIGNILANDNLKKEFYNHPLIMSLHSQGGKRKPSKVPSKQFTSVVFDMLIKAAEENSDKAVDVARKAGTGKSHAKKVESVIEQLRGSIDQLNGNDNSELQGLARVLDTLLIDVSKDVENVDAAIGDARKRVENWFDDAMERVSGAYKRKAQLWSLIIGIVLAGFLNADSLSIANHLWSDPLAREALVAQAEQLRVPPDQLGQDAQKAATEYFNQLQSLSQDLSIPLGWTTDNVPVKGTKDFGNQWALKIGGILLSGMAAAQGAPYWFEIVRKLLSFRSGGASEPAPAKKEEEAKK